MYNIIIINKKNKQKRIIKNIECANNFQKRLLGLMGKSNFNGLIFKQTSKNRFLGSIHTCFMKTKIDVIYINSEMKIQELVELEQWKLYIPKNGEIKYIIELPENSIQKYGLNNYSKIVIENEKTQTG
jgi:uncharacterized membrane protein (UPF0127 family)